MPKLNFSDRTIRNLKTSNAQQEYWDATTAGFGLRISRQGRKTFFCRYRVGKLQRRLNLGEFPAMSLAEARRKYYSIQNKLIEGDDPQLVRKTTKLAETVDELFQIYLDDREGKIAPETITRYRGNYRRALEKEIGQIRARDLRKAHVIPLLRKLGERAPTQCHRVQALLQSFLNHALALDLIEFNPLHKLPNFGFTRVGDRHLFAAELVEYLRALDKFPIVEQTYFYLMIFYGCRSGELAKWQWSWIRRDRIAIPSEHQKNSRALTLPITPKVDALLNELREETGDTTWLFPNPTRSNYRQSFNKNRETLAGRIDLEQPWALRDLRRTAETQMRELGISSEVTSVILNHNTSHLRKIYDRSENLAEKRAALMRYEKYLATLKEKGEPEKVVDLASYSEAVSR